MDGRRGAQPVLSLVPWEHAGARPGPIVICWLLRRQQGGEGKEVRMLRRADGKIVCKRMMRAYKRASTTQPSASLPLPLPPSPPPPLSPPFPFLCPRTSKRTKPQLGSSSTQHWSVTFLFGGHHRDPMYLPRMPEPMRQAICTTFKLSCNGEAGGSSGSR
jgi:hypothetical protein